MSGVMEIGERGTSVEDLERAVVRVARELVSREPGRVHRTARALFDRALIRYVLGVTAGNQLRAARLLGMNRNTLRKRTHELGVGGVTAAGETPRDRDPRPPR